MNHFLIRYHKIIKNNVFYIEIDLSFYKIINNKYFVQFNMECTWAFNEIENILFHLFYEM